MPDQNAMPDEQMPEGARLPETPSEDPAPQTMIGEGEPLPVGANDPEVVEQTTVTPPPGMPKVPDDVDAEIAEFYNAIVNDGAGIYEFGRPAAAVEVRPDQATLSDALSERIIDGYADHTSLPSRDLLLVAVQRARAGERTAATRWAEAVRAQQEYREIYLRTQQIREEHERTLGAMDLLGPADFEGPTGPVARQARIADAEIV